MTPRTKWWSAPENEAHATIVETCNKLALQADPRWSAWRRYENIYGDSYWNDNPDKHVTEQPKRRLTINRARVLTETYTSKLLKSRVLPMVVVKDADTATRFRARDCNLFLEGAFDDLGVYDQDPQWCGDLANKGTYWAHVYEVDDEPVVERVDPFEILLDDTDWQYGNGRVIFRQRIFDRGVLAELYPDHEELILKAPKVPSDSPLMRDRTMDMDDQVLVTFAWHLKSGPDATDGRYCVVLPNVTLEDTVGWDDDELPFAWGWRTRPTRGVWGHPLMADLATPQETLDRWTRRIDESMRLMCVPRVIMRKGASIVPEKMTNEIGTILTTENPQGDIVPFNFDGISNQGFQYMQTIENEMQTLARTSLLSTQGQVPTGIKSGVALRIMEETDVEGLREPMRYRDRFFVRIAKLLSKVFDRLGGFETMARGKIGKNRALKYEDVKLTEGSYRWAVMPTSFFARTPAARMDQAFELVGRGLLSPDQVANFLDIPEMESITNRITAQADAINMRIDKILTDGDADAAVPIGVLNLAKARAMASDAYAQAEADGAEQDKLDLLVQFITEIDRMQNPAPAPMPQGPAMQPPETLPGMGGGMPPGAPPGMPPGMPPMPPGAPPMPPPGMGMPS